MAPSVVVYHSQEMIDVSKGAHTPVNSSPAADNPPTAGTTQERVQDSLNDHVKPNADGAVPPSQQYAEDEDDDELYDLSPKGKASMDAARGKLTKAALEQPLNGSANFGRSGKPAVKPPAHGGAVGNGVDDLLTNGVIVRQSQTERHRAKLAVHRDDAEPTSEKVSTPVLKPVNTAKSNAKGAQRPASATQRLSGTTDAGTNSRSTDKLTIKPGASAGTSALAALRAKKEGLASIESSDAGVQKSRNRTEAVATALKNSSTRPALKERSKNAQTPARNAVKAAMTEQQPTDGKLKSRKLGMFAQTPMGGQKQSMPAEHKRKGGGTAHDDDIEDVDAPRPTKNARSAQQNASGNVKRPIKASEATRLTNTQRPTYDMPGYPSPHTKAAKRSKQPQPAAKMAPPKPAVRKKAEMVDAEQAGPTEQKHRGLLRKSAKLPDSEDAPEPAPSRKQPARKAKGFDGAVVAGNTMAGRRHDQAATIPEPINARTNDAEAESKEGDSLDQETIEDFEHAVVAFEDDSKPTAADLHGHRTSPHNGAPVTTHEDATVRPVRPADQHQSHSVKESPVQAAERHEDSQEKANVLSDRPDPDSSQESTPAVASTAPAALASRKGVTTKPVGAPQTPAVFHSSPPLERQRVGGQVPAGLVDAVESRRSTIISFDRSGPRNQGTRSAEKTAVGSARTDRTSLPPRKGPLASEASSARARLKARRRNPPSSAATSMKSYRTIPTAPPNNVAEHVGDALAGFLKHPARLAPTPTPFKDAPKANSRAQRRSPTPKPPQPVDQADDGWMYIGDVPDTAALNLEAAETAEPRPKSSFDRTASQHAMPPPEPKPSRAVNIERAPIVPAMAGSGSVVEGVAVGKPKKHAAKPSSKRPVEDEATDQPVSKKRKVAVPTMLETSRGTLPETADRPAERVHTKPTRPSKAPSPVLEPTERLSRKVSRHASQNVDLHGSPIPKDLIVPDNATALETYSHQAGLSSDKAVPESKIAAPHTDFEQRGRDAAFFEEFLAVPTHQPEILSSNEKRKPASPREESQAITSIVFGQVNLKQLVIRDEDALPPTDPFTSSEELRKPPSKQSSSSLFGEQLRARAEQVARKRRHEDYAEDEDPERTLVEPEPEPRRPKRLASLPRQDAFKSSTTPAGEAVDMSAIGMWRNGLQPHQTNLFDELVAVSHRLVRHLVDHETAMHEAVSDYRRQGINVIEQMELLQACEYQQSLKKLEQSKKLAQQDLNRRSERLQGVMEEMKQKKAERVRTAGKLDEEERKLKEMLAQLGGA